ncbi:endolysin [Microbacterium phage Margaery]|uniref:Endolysin n=1 Tax=Microbacterium phage Margaery TaxID=2591217 RepID=A0A514DHM4_9CAUD|nr:endolysin [Microbacterium phage Margaery]QDH93094.1 endolysin [Microbacterium phage Margaery]
MSNVVVWPNGGVSTPRVTSEFGMRVNPVTGVYTLHAGIDLIGWSIIKAPADGVVTFAGYNGGAGNEVRIKRPNGDVFRLMHNKELWVRAGQSVSVGQDIAVMGTTGNSTGVHCHFETHPGGGAAINPRTYMAQAITGGGAGGGGDDMGAAEMAVLKNIEAILVGTGPSLTDPNFIGGAGSIYNRLLNLSAHVYAGGPSAADPNYLGAPGTLYALAKAPVNRTVMVDGKPVAQKIAQIQDNADTNTFVRQILPLVQGLAARPVVEFTDEQTALLADGLADALTERGVGGASAEEVKAALSDVLGRLVLRAEPEPA